MVEREREFIISNDYFTILYEAAKTVGVKLYEVKWKKLGEICEIKTGTKPKYTVYESGKYKYINSGTRESGYLDKFNYEFDTVTTPSRGQGGIGYIGYQPENFWLGALCYGIKSKNNLYLKNKYIYYYLRSSNKVISLKKEGGTPAVNLEDLSSIKLLIPNIEVQNYIVSILDKFDTLVNDIKQGLPKEIELRQKQYEYFRERLLDFPKNN